MATMKMPMAVGTGSSIDDASMTSTSATLTSTTPDKDTALVGEINITTLVSASSGVIGTVSPLPTEDTRGILTLKTNVSDTRAVVLKTNGQLVNLGSNMAANNTWLISLYYKKA